MADFNCTYNHGLAEFKTICQDVDNFQGTNDAARRMLQALETQGYSQEAQVLKVQLDEGRLPKLVTFTGVMEEYAEAGDILKVVGMFMIISYHEFCLDRPNAYTNSVVIKALAKTGHLELAIRYMLEMMKKGMQPNVETYTAVFVVCARCMETIMEEEDNEELLEDEDELKEFVKLMKARGFNPEKEAVMEVLTAKNTEASVVERVCNFLFEDSEDDDELQQLLSSQIQPPGSPYAINTFTRMFDALIEGGYFRDAMEMKAATLDKGLIPDEVVQTGLMEAYAMAGMTEEVLNVYNCMISSDEFTGNPYTNGALIRALSADREFLGEAKKCWLKMHLEGVAPYAYTYLTLYGAMCDAGVEEEELEEFKREIVAQRLRMLRED